VVGFIFINWHIITIPYTEIPYEPMQRNKIKAAETWVRVAWTD
jgi:hypothetical protein